MNAVPFEQKVVGGFCVVALLMLMHRAFLWEPNVPPPPPPKDCTGEPIFVDYAYQGGNKDPHACKAQCGTSQKRFVLYTDNIGTQCEAPPGCNDWGEDNGITCAIPIEYK